MLEKKKKRPKYPKIARAFKGLRDERDIDVERDYTQGVLSKQIGIQKPQISQLENGKRLPSTNELMAYSKEFNAPMEYLLGQSENRYYEHQVTGKDLGLSDKVIKEFKKMKKSNLAGDYVYILNHIFEINEGGNFLRCLEDYLFLDYKDVNDEAHISPKGTNEIWDTFKAEDLNYIRQQALYKTLSDIKDGLKREGLRQEQHPLPKFGTK